MVIDLVKNSIKIYLKFYFIYAKKVHKYNDRLHAYIVENTFTSLPEIGKELFSSIPGIFYLPEIFFKNQVENLNLIKIEIFNFYCLSIKALRK